MNAREERPSIRCRVVMLVLQHEAHCDLCNETIAQQDFAVAVTTWSSEVGEIGDWEKDFGVPLQDEAYQMARILARGPP